MVQNILGATDWSHLEPRIIDNFLVFAKITEASAHYLT